MTRVVISGVGLVSPLGQTFPEVIDAIRHNRSGASYIPEWDNPSFGLQTRVGARVNFNEQAFDRKLKRTMSRVSMMAKAATEQALEDAKLPPELIKSERTGISYGSSFGGTSTIEEYFQGYQNSGILVEGVTATTFLKVMPHTCAANIAISFGIPGRIMASCVACASSTQATGYAYEAIKAGHVDRVVCGGAEELTPTVAAIFDVLYATSTKSNTSPEKAAKPFDADRDGIVVGEGAGTFILERYEDAKARGAKIYAEIVGFYTNNDASHMTNPSVEGLQNCMRGALRSAGLDVNDIDAVNAHAAGTAAGDRSEALAIEGLFGKRPAVSSMKGHLGHLMGAAGAMEISAALGMFQDQKVYPTLNLSKPDEARIHHVMGTAEARPLRFILKNSFAFGGVNSSLILRHLEE